MWLLWDFEGGCARSQEQLDWSAESWPEHIKIWLKRLKSEEWRLLKQQIIEDSFLSHTFRCLHTKNWSLFPFFLLQMQLREAHEVIADKNMLIEEKEHLMTLVKHEKEELARENQVQYLHTNSIFTQHKYQSFLTCIYSVRLSWTTSRGCAEFTTTSAQLPAPTHLTRSLTPPHQLQPHPPHRNRLRTCMRT